MTSHHLPRVALFLVAGVSAFALLFQLRAPGAGISAEEIEAIGAWLHDRVAPEDVVRFEPTWATELETVLRVFPSADISGGGMRPVVDRTPVFDRYLGRGYRRLWLVSGPDATLAETPAEWRRSEERRFASGVRVTLFELASERYGYDLQANLAHARVSRKRSPQRDYRTCRARQGYHDCNGKPWENVRSDWHHVGGAPRQCFVLHPYPDHGTVRIRWSDVPLGKRLVLRSGFVLEAARNEHGADCTVTVTVGEDVMAQWQEPKNAWHFQEHILDTAFAAGTKRTVEITVTTPDEDFRDLCFDGFVVLSD